MKRFIILLLFIMMISGCSQKRTESNNTNNMMTKILPFLYFSNQSEQNVEAKLAAWDLGKGSVSLSDEVVYTASLKEGWDVEPITWDGKYRLRLNKYCLPSDLYKNTTAFENYSELDTYIGRNIKVKLNWDKNPDPISKKVESYELFLDTKEGLVQKEGKFFFTAKDGSQEIVVGEGHHLMCVDFNNETGTIKLVFRNIFEVNPRIYVANANIDNLSKVRWEAINTSDLGLYFSSPKNIQMDGSKIYAPCFTSLAVINLEEGIAYRLDGAAKDCRSVVKEGSFSPEFSKDILPIGLVNDVLIVRVPVSTDVDLEYLICALKGEAFLGAIHVKNSNEWVVYDSSKKTTSSLKLDELNLYKNFGTDVLQFPAVASLI